MNFTGGIAFRYVATLARAWVFSNVESSHRLATVAANPKRPKPMNSTRFSNCIRLLLLLSLASVTSIATAEDFKPFGDVLAKSTGEFEFADGFSDEFEGGSVDTKKWNNDTEDWGTWSWEPENAFQKDGSLNLRMVQEDHERQGKKLAYKSGIARSKDTIVYGYFEARVKGCERFPGASPAFWLHSKGPQNRYAAADGETVAYSEIDIIELQQGEWSKETRKNNGPDIIDCNLHNVLIKGDKRMWQRPRSHPETNKNEYHAPFDPRDDYHVYAAENSKEYVVWYVDGMEVARRKNTYWHLPMHVTLSLGLRRPFEDYKGGGRNAILEATTKEGFPTTMLVDYVRVWKNTSVAPAATAPAKKQAGSGKKGMAAAGGSPAATRKGPGDKDLADWIALEKPKWEKNGWKWNEEKVKANFEEMDVNGDGIASGMERKKWFEKKAAAN